MAEALSLDATTRAETGRHVRALRRKGFVPAVLYGHRVEATPIAIEAHRLERVWHRAGHSHLVDLSMDGGRARKVLIRELQVDPRSADVLHVDLFVVNLREKLVVDVPIVVTGESPAVSELKVGVLQQLMNSMRIECLPGDLPAQLTIDVSGLDAVDAGLHVRDIALPENVALAHGVEPDELVVKVAPMRVVEVEEEEAAEVEEPAAEGEAPAEAGEETQAES